MPARRHRREAASSFTPPSSSANLVCARLLNARSNLCYTQTGFPAKSNLITPISGGCMRFPARPFVLLFILMVLLAACGPATPAPTPTPAGLANSKIMGLPNVAVTVAPPALAGPCIPPVPNIGAISSFCANPIKGLGGVSYSDYSDWNNVGTEPAGSFLVGDSIPGNVTCNFDQGSSDAICSGPQNGTFQAMVCGYCTSPDAPPPSDPAPNGWTCSQGYTDVNGQCIAIDPKQVYDFCPAGSHYDNALQNCADDATNKLASPCPDGFKGAYSPESHICWEKPYPAVYNCQTIQVNLGACVAPSKIAVNVVPFCQSSTASKGGANITVPAGSRLSVDIKGNRLDSYTPGATQPDGTQLLTCLGTAGMPFNVQVCTDTSTCTSYAASLGACAVKREKPGAPAPPKCVHC